MATTAPTFESAFAFTATGELGKARESMLQNELLLRVRKRVMYFRDRAFFPYCPFRFRKKRRKYGSVLK